MVNALSPLTTPLIRVPSALVARKKSERTSRPCCLHLTILGRNRILAE